METLKIYHKKLNGEIEYSSTWNDLTPEQKSLMLKGFNRVGADGIILTEEISENDLNCIKKIMGIIE